MPDWALVGQTLSEKLRLRSDLLKRIGWRYIRVHSFELFSDPQAVALRIAEQLGMQISLRPQPLFENERAFEDTDAAWGDRTENNDDRLRGDVPPHWQ
jgi:LPS sulfotransferase NodH